MDFSFFLTLFSLIWQMLSGWISILGDLGLDGITDITGLLSNLL